MGLISWLAEKERSAHGPFTRGLWGGMRENFDSHRRMLRCIFDVRFLFGYLVRGWRTGGRARLAAGSTLLSGLSAIATAFTLAWLSTESNGTGGSGFYDSSSPWVFGVGTGASVVLWLLAQWLSGGKAEGGDISASLDEWDSGAVVRAEQKALRKASSPGRKTSPGSSPRL